MSKNIEQQFTNSTRLAKLLPPTTSNDDLLCLYGFYKQATIGDCNIKKPTNILFSNNYSFDKKPMLKWEAWSKNAGMKKKEAMRNYINAISIIINK